MTTVVVPLVTPSENENIEQFSKQYGAETILAQLNELHSKYKFMEAQLHRTKQVLRGKLPDITSTLQMVEHLASHPAEMTIDFQLADNVWSKAQVPHTESVYLWLGANVMLEYTHEEARELLTRNLDSANQSLGSTDEDLKFLKEQLTTCEVNVARVYNYSVAARRQGK